MPVQNKLKEIRLEKKLTQQKLAQRCGVGQSTISEIEKGRHMLMVEVALLVARVLETTVDELFYLVE